MLLHVVGSQSRRRHGRGAEGEARCQQQRQEGRFEPHCVNEVGDLRIAREQGGKVRTFRRHINHPSNFIQGAFPPTDVTRDASTSHRRCRSPSRRSAFSEVHRPQPPPSRSYSSCSRSICTTSSSAAPSSKASSPHGWPGSATDGGARARARRWMRPASHDLAGRSSTHRACSWMSTTCAALTRPPTWPVVERRRRLPCSTFTRAPS